MDIDNKAVPRTAPAKTALGRRPALGELIVLVYREASDGCWCATGEGDFAPVCSHGWEMLPLAGGREEGESGSSDAARLGFALVPEAEAVRDVLETRRAANVVGAG